MRIKRKVHAAKAASGGEKPETGDIYIDGISIYEKGENAYCNFGYMSKEYGFYSLLKGRRILRIVPGTV